MLCPRFAHWAQSCRNSLCSGTDFALGTSSTRLPTRFTHLCPQGVRSTVVGSLPFGSTACEIKDFFAPFALALQSQRRLRTVSGCSPKLFALPSRPHTLYALKAFARLSSAPCLLGLHIYIGCINCVLFNEITSWCDVITHQDIKQLVAKLSVFKANAF